MMVEPFGSAQGKRGKWKEERSLKERGESGRGGRQSHGSASQRHRGDGSHEEGMVRLKLNKGKSSGIRPNDIVGTIAFHANIPGYTIGKIRIEDKFTFVDVPEDLVEQVLKHNGNYRLGKEKLTLTTAK
jgi:ATP-dependent RNA helicase DeaD